MRRLGRPAGVRACRRPVRRRTRERRLAASDDATGLQLSLDFDASVAPTRRRPPADRPCRASPDRGRRPRSTAIEPTDPRDALAAAIGDPTPDRGRRRSGCGSACSSRGCRPRPRSGSASLLDDPRPRRGHAARPRPRRHRRPDGRGGRAEAAAPPSGRSSSGSARRSSATRSSRSSSPRFADDARRRRPTPVAFDTQIAAYILNASLRSQIDRRRRRRAARPDPAAGRRAAAMRRGPVSRRSRRSPSARRSRRPSTEESLDRLFREIELPLIPVLARMEATGVALDRDALRSWPTEFGAEIARLEAEIYADVGHEFNLGSPKQLEQVLFFELNLPKGKRTKTGYSTDASVLEDLAPGPSDDRQAARVADLHEAPLDLRRGAADADRRADGRLHTTFHQAVAATGRLSLVRPEPPEHPDPDAARPADPARVRGRRSRRDPASRPTTPRSSCGSSPTSRATSTSATRSPAAPTSTARRPPGSSTRRPRTSPRTSGRWPRWSTSGSPTA